MANKRIRMTVEFDINENTLTEKGLQLEDVLNGLAFHESDVSDGFEITTNIPGCDCTADFFLTAGTVVGVEEIEPPKVNKLDKINSYKSNEKLLQDAKEQKIEAEVQELCARIRALKPRIDELLETGNACLENGIEVNAYGNSFYRDWDKYEKGTFVTNSISHKVGFVKEWRQYDKGLHKFTQLGINNGGACGCYDFRTDGERIYFVNENNRTDIKGPSHKTRDLKEFLEDFDTFETEFYKYVDKVIEKQQSSVDRLITNATGRVKEGNPSMSEKEIDR